MEPLADSLYPSGQVQMNAPGVFIQCPINRCRTLLIFSSISYYECVLIFSKPVPLKISTWFGTYVHVSSCTLIHISAIMTIRIRFITIRALADKITRNIFTSSIVSAWVKTCFTLINVYTLFRSFERDFYFKTGVTIAIVSTEFIETGT